MPEMETPKTTAYHEISKAVDDWMPLHKDEIFDLDLVCRQLNIVATEARKYVSMKLANEVRAKRIEKNGSKYRIIDNTINTIDWMNAENSKGISLNWPWSRFDQRFFGFSNCVSIPEKSIIIIAGVTNVGKTTFCLNFLWENMDEFPCTLQGNEYSPSDLKEKFKRLQEATGKNPVNEKGKPKFEVIERFNNWADVIRPNNVNIIDWLNLDGDKLYNIGNVLQGIKEKLDKGVCLVAIQKDPRNELGRGGQFSEELASLYLTLDFERITVKKAKRWQDYNPNGKAWGFHIIDHGTQFSSIRPLQKCGACYQGKTKAGDCQICGGSGWVNSEEQAALDLCGCQTDIDLNELRKSVPL